MSGATTGRDGVVSVVIPVFNGEDRVADAIGSAIDEGSIVGEIIVVDDGSTDGTIDVVGRFPGVHLLRQANAGPASARNAAIRASSGEYIAPLDHDDLFVPGRLEVMVSALEDAPGAAYAVGRQKLVIESGEPLPYWLPSTDERDLDRFRNEHATGMMLARRWAFELVGNFDETFTGAGEDVDWIFRCIELGHTSVALEEFVTIRRMRGDNLTMDKSANQRAMLQILQRRARRRRVQ